MHIPENVAPLVAHIVIYSGGMDSFTLINRVYRTQHRGTVHALSFNYGQKHVRELEFARMTCAELGIIHATIDLPKLDVFHASALTTAGKEIPEGHYEEASMGATVVPGRNTVMLAMALSFAESLLMSKRYKYERAVIYYGAHSGDHHIYPDCRLEFFRSMQRTILLASDQKVNLSAPYIQGDKKTILTDGFSMGLNYAKSWTCYKGDVEPCGKCGSCVERAEAFAFHEAPDPLIEAAKSWARQNSLDI